MEIELQQKLNLSEIKTLCISAVGGALEFYDFIVYVFFAQLLAQLFFNSSSVVSSLLLSFSVFASGYLARVIGGLVLSHYGDKYGRKNSFALTVFLMAFPTLCIGLLPTYSSIGFLSTILLVTCRILQGLAIGGEIPCSITFVFEHASYKHRGLACGILFCGIISGIFLGSFVGAIVTKCFSEGTLISWAWRIPFLLGGLLGFIGVYLRRYLNETPAFQKMHADKTQSTAPLKKVIKEYSFVTITSITSILSVAVAVTLYLLYLPTYLHVYFNFPSDSLLEINSIAIIIYSLFIVLFGFLSDKINPRIIFNFGLIIFIIFSYPVFSFLQENSYTGIYIIYAMVAVANSAITSSAVFLLAESYPTQIRYSGVSFSYNIAFGVFGGFTPFICTYIINITKINAAPAFYIIFVCCLALVFSLISNQTLREGYIKRFY